MTTAISNMNQAMDAMLAQMRSTAKMAGFADVFNPVVATTPGVAQGATPTAGFAGIFKQALDKVAAMQNTASARAQAFTLGEPDVSLNDVMIDTQKASMALQATVQVRNRLVAAYQEIANMAV